MCVPGSRSCVLSGVFVCEGGAGRVLGSEMMGTPAKSVSAAVECALYLRTDPLSQNAVLGCKMLHQVAMSQHVLAADRHHPNPLNETLTRHHSTNRMQVGAAQHRSVSSMRSATLLYLRIHCPVRPGAVQPQPPVAPTQAVSL